MQLQSQNNTQIQVKPQNMLLLQASIIDTRMFSVHSLQEALQKMIKIYCELITLKNASNPQVKDTITFSLKSMIEYYSSMDNIMYMEKEPTNVQANKNQHVTKMQSFDKDFVLASLRTHCVKKSTENSIELAKMMFKNGQNSQDLFRNMGFNL